jgi:hypothetical protein
VKLLAALLIGVTCFILIVSLDPYDSPGDWYQAAHPTALWLQGRDPLEINANPEYIPNPPTIIVIGLPFAFSSQPLSAAIFFSASAALLAWITRREMWRWLLFLSYPFMDALGSRQWSPLLMTLALTDLGAVGLLIKPNIALPLFLIYRSNRFGLALTIIIFIISLAVFPWWPLRWLNQLHGYTGSIAALSPIGLLAFAVALWTRRPLIALYCLVPVRGLYDLLPLFLVIDAPFPLALLTLSSWLLYGLPPELARSMFLLCAVLLSAPLGLQQMTWKIPCVNRSAAGKRIGERGIGKSH